MKKNPMKVLSLLGLAAIVTAAPAAGVISFNIDNNGTVGNPDGTYNNLMVAGVVPTIGWINDWNTYPTTDLPDNTGTATTMDYSSSSNSGTWSQGGHPGQDADTTFNREMLNGYLNGTGANSTSITLSQIPYSLYDVYVYVASDNASRSGTVTDGTTTFSFGVLDGMVAGPNALLVETTDTGLSYPEANYAVFRNLSGDNQTFSTSFLTTGEYGGISAFQVVEIVPEPSVVLSGALGFLGLLRRRRA
ncbi:PEP-CTERM sorting domain-containing protein [Haloferula sargassicola]|uniref:PEP-CTERM protein-sorting domain-containing protein n=1 Tax=Haloferula sargassicola TaxID=490096 RepID=A0ABP9UNE5_9BACT